MNPEEFYEPRERSALRDPQKRALIHSAYWHGVDLAKTHGCPQTTPADNRALELALLKGFLESRDYRKGVSPG